MIQVGILGAGTMGRMHAETITKSGFAKVASIYAAAGDGGPLASSCAATAVKNAEDVIQDPAIDAVVIACPTDTHATYLKACHAAGKHIFCEKPAVRTEEEAAEIEALFKGYAKKVMIGHVLRFFAEYRHLHDTAASGALGNIGTVRLSRCASPPRGVGNWFANQAQSGGVIFDLSIHDMDALLWSFGDAERVFSMRSGITDLAQDYALTVVRLKSGAIAHLEASWVESPGTFTCTYEVAGSEGLLEYDSRVEPVMCVAVRETDKDKGAQTMMPSNPTAVSPYELEMRNFLEAVQSGAEVAVTLESGIKSVRLALAALKSSETGQPVTL